jgi:hypothetical protein
MDIIDTLHDHMEEPDIVTLLLSSISTTFRRHHPHSHITISAEEDPDAILVNLNHPPFTYRMEMSDSWQDTPHFRFHFTNTQPPHDTITVDLAS